MARNPANKSTLQELRKRLDVYRHVLPSLDLKQRQLAVHLAEARARVFALRAAAAKQVAEIGVVLPELADPCLALEDWLRVTAVVQHERALLGVRFPVFERIETAVAPRAMLGTPPWWEHLHETLTDALGKRLALAAASAESAALEAGLRRTQQRINLFEKRLIPQVRAEIRRIEVALDDAARAAVVRAKIARSHGLRQRSRVS